MRPRVKLKLSAGPGMTFGMHVYERMGVSHIALRRGGERDADVEGASRKAGWPASALRAMRVRFVRAVNRLSAVPRMRIVDSLWPPARQAGAADAVDQGGSVDAPPCPAVFERLHRYAGVADQMDSLRAVMVRDRPCARIGDDGVGGGSFGGTRAADGAEEASPRGPAARGGDVAGIPGGR